MKRQSQGQPRQGRQQRSPGQLAASRLHSYLAFRAEREGVGYALTERFFAGWFARGFRFFFGIYVCDCGELLFDEQNPEAFRAFGLATQGR